MKYIVTIIGLISLMACSSEETTRTAETLGNTERPIAFNAAYTVQPTRSSEAFTATKGIPVGQSMGVYAYLHNTETRNYSADIPNFMFNQQATSQDDAEPFSYTPLKYWPNDENSKVSFIAYFPYSNGADDDGTNHDIASTGVTPLLENNGTGLPTFNFTVKDNVDDQVDFLVSEVVPNLPKTRDTEGDPHQPFNDLTVYDRVPFVFKHMTAKVEFRIVAAAEVRDAIAHFRLNSLNVSNLYKDGKLTPTYSDGTTTYTWTEQSAKHGTADTDPAYAFPLNTQASYLFMPQQLSDDVKLNLDYTVTLKSDGTTYTYDNEGNLVPQQDYTYSNEASIQLNTMKRTGSETALTEWLPNHHYIYTIRLRANRIEFTGQVVEWGDYGNTEEIKIEEK